MVQWTDKPAPKPHAPQADDEAPATAPRLTAPRISARRPQRGTSNGMQGLVVMGLAIGLGVASWFLISQVSHVAQPAGPASRASIATTSERDAGLGRIVVSDRGDCREMGFDNYSGQTIAKGKVDCDAAASPDATQSLYRHPTNRLDAVRKSFQGQQ